MTEPTDAFKVEGENLSFPLSPAVTVATGLDTDVLVPEEGAACKPTTKLKTEVQDEDFQFQRFANAWLWSLCSILDEST
jgi:hypothetical protein